LILGSSGRTKGLGKFSEVTRYYASGKSEGVTLINGETVPRSFGTWSVRRSSILVNEEVRHIEGDSTLTGRYTLFDKSAISGVLSASDGARSKATFRREKR